ncbi:MAG: twin-arginine translocase subunit TatC [Nitrososphaerota archaeon]|nr:twin-arginine translocase subunit TatC [Nitrososphaerota archaeon]
MNRSRETDPDLSVTFWEHLGELKRRAKVIIIAYVASVVFWLLGPAGKFDAGALFTGIYRPMIAVVLNNAQNLAGGRITIIAGALTAPLEIYFLASAVMALITSSPVIAYEIYKFVDPALRPGEKGTLSKFILGFAGLFCVGAAVGYFVLVPAIIRFMSYFAGIVGAEPVITAGDYYGMVFMAVAAAALAFTTPVVFALLVGLGVLSTRAFTKNRLVVYLLLYVAIAALTPEPVVGHFGMFLPIVGMLEVSVLAGKKIERDRARRSGTAPPPERPRCRYCNSKLKPEERFCAKCGSALA